MSNAPTNYSPTLARLLTAPERCKQSRGKQRQTPPAATVVSSNTVNLLNYYKTESLKTIK